MILRCNDRLYNLARQKGIILFTNINKNKITTKAKTNNIKTISFKP